LSRVIPKYRKTIIEVIEGVKNTHFIYKTLMEKRSGKIDDCDDLMAMFMKEVTKRKNDKDPHYFTEKQCNYLLSDLFGAGVETSVNTLRWFLLYMALNKDIQVNKSNIKLGVTFYYYYDLFIGIYDISTL
jgi:ecdysteroid 25-hydroxylase CYP306A1